MYHCFPTIFRTSLAVFIRIAFSIPTYGVVGVHNAVPVWLPATCMITMYNHTWREVDGVIVTCTTNAVSRSRIGPSACGIGNRGREVVTHGAYPYRGIRAAVRRY
jgi:hypothetical protein